MKLIKFIPLIAAFLMATAPFVQALPSPIQSTALNPASLDREMHARPMDPVIRTAKNKINDDPDPYAPYDPYADGRLDTVEAGSYLLVDGIIKFLKHFGLDTTEYDKHRPWFLPRSPVVSHEPVKTTHQEPNRVTIRAEDRQTEVNNEESIDYHIHSSGMQKFNDILCVNACITQEEQLCPAVPLKLGYCEREGIPERCIARCWT